MSRRRPSLSNVEYTTYEFTASSAIDYNYDPSGSTTAEPAFDPYTDTYESPPPSSPAREDNWHSRYTRVPRGDYGGNAYSRRTPSPPPRAPIPTSPSPEYISESKKPSTRLNVPVEARKLLILDLNGTLVYRTPHVQREFRQARRHARAAQHHQAHDYYHGGSSYQPYSHHDSRPYEASHSPYSSYSNLPPMSGDAYSDQTAPRPLRVVHPRPYMRAFREYLFHPSTRAWLDTMVWSSAQPHSVADMVNKCFGSLQEDLLTVWARDTLGLEEKDYNRKVQTTKNLAKPWSELPITPSSDPNTPQFHSAHTTLLMDDSPRKAYLQPYNHLCVREYTGALRQIDVQCRQREQRLQQILNARPTSLPPKPQADTGASPAFSESALDPADASVSPSDSPYSPRLSPTLAPSQSANKKRKRPKKKHATLELAEAEDDFVLGLGGYDPTLLAIVGVLEKIKWEGNVAGWMRSGGLAKSYLEEEAHEGREEKDEGKQANEKEEEEEEGSNGEKEKAKDKDKEKEKEKEKEKDASLSTDAGAPHDPKRRRVSDEHVPLPLLANGESASPSSSPSLAALAAASPTLPAAATTLETIGDTGQWFEDQTVLRFWVRKGVTALEGLGIEVSSGIVA
ncbi:hypothetical protein C0993_007150 [Termitomyces sp. T159_Od127]|nr:hypothetical protein C0993_007150 [Termitomyces sp. T159_Od127]